MPTKPLPPNASLESLEQQALQLLEAHEERTLDAAQRIREFHPAYRASNDAEIAAASLDANDAQLAVAREYGFASWPRLKVHLEDPHRDEKARLPHHERIADPAFRTAVALLDAGDAEGLRAHLQANPAVIRLRVIFEGANYFTSPTLLEFVAENPTRRGRLPANIADVTRVILDAGAKSDWTAVNSALELVSSSLVARECGVQAQLIDLLCDYGADPNAGVYTALLYGEFAAVDKLIARGAKRDLIVAAATGNLGDARASLSQADAEQRQRAFALAAQHGHVGVVRFLLDASEDPNRYAPVGGHSHATPLHQAALGGHDEVVRLLVERGARLDLRDLHHHATPCDWAEYAGQTEVSRYLRKAAAGAKEVDRIGP